MKYVVAADVHEQARKIGTGVSTQITKVCKHWG